MTWLCCWENKIGPGAGRCAEQCPHCRRADAEQPRVESDGRTNLDLVREFHEVFMRPIRSTPTMPSYAERQLRADLIAEELEELEEAFEREDLEAAADALGDLLYVVYGTGVEMGIDLNAVLREIHRSNLTKLDEHGRAILREDGKVLKSDRYTPPDLNCILGLPV